MAKVITFSRVFPVYHPKAGQQTFFREKLWAGWADLLPQGAFKIPDEATDWDWYEYYNAKPKWNTIRAGHRWKVGDWFSPKVWGNDINPKSGRTGPYQSKQITIGPLIQVKNVWDFTLCEVKDDDGPCWRVASIDTCSLPDKDLERLAANDGLNLSDMLSWFKYPKPFDGQIICWNENVNY